MRRENSKFPWSRLQVSALIFSNIKQTIDYIKKEIHTFIEWQRLYHLQLYIKHFKMMHEWRNNVVIIKCKHPEENCSTVEVSY